VRDHGVDRGQYLIGDVLGAPSEMDEFLAAIGGMRAASGQAVPFEGTGQQGHAGAADEQLPR